MSPGVASGLVGVVVAAAAAAAAVVAGKMMARKATTWNRHAFVNAGVEAVAFGGVRD